MIKESWLVVLNNDNEKSNFPFCCWEGGWDIKSPLKLNIDNNTIKVITATAIIL